MRRGTAIVVGLLVAAAPAVAAAGERIVLVPLDNLTRASGAREAIMPALTEGLEQKGYEIVAGQEVEDYLRSKRIRYLDSLPAAQTAELLTKLDAQAVMVGSILMYDRRRTDPVVGLSLTVLGAQGQVLWSDVAGLAASGSRGALDLGKTSDLAVLARRLVKRMLEDVPPEQMERAPSTSRLSFLRRRPRVFRSPDVPGEDLTICVLPLENRSGARDAPRIAEAAILHELAHKPGVKPVLAADLRRFVVDSGMRAPSRLTLEQLQRLAKTAQTRYFLQGSIFAYGMSGSDQGATPVVEIYLRLLDVESGRTIWSGLHKRTGVEYEKLLRLGAVRDSATLVTHTVGELIDAFTR